ncbi:MAG: hypothetical protein M1826_005011 [Phylliscum demangeonii]|nr:MAG: hypothetical protein M1826_005011 [Phylliscum demangeonii]
MASEAVPISITICGDGGCGKSSITLRLVKSDWTDDYDPTIEDSYSITRHLSGQAYTLHLTDTAGQEEYRNLWASSNLHSDAFLLVYDITHLPSLHALDHFLALIDLERDRRAEAGGVLPVVIIAGNKCDLAAGQRQVSRLRGCQYAHARRCGFMETSAKERVGIDETFACAQRDRNDNDNGKDNGKDHPREREGCSPLAPSTLSVSPPLPPRAGSRFQQEQSAWRRRLQPRPRPRPRRRRRRRRRAGPREANKHQRRKDKDKDKEEEEEEGAKQNEEETSEQKEDDEGKRGSRREDDDGNDNVAHKGKVMVVDSLLPLLVTSTRRFDRSIDRFTPVH